MGYEHVTWTPGRVLVVAGALAIMAGSVWSLIGRFTERDPVDRSDALGVHLIDQYDTSDLRVDREQIIPGGPWKDDIPSLTTLAARPLDQHTTNMHGPEPPTVLPVTEADLMDDGDRVIGVTIEGESRAYSLNVLEHHEVINDVLAGIPIAVIYCPLCDSASIIDRRIDGETLEFGISGLLYNSNVLMYDRTHLALWSQERMGAVSGPYAGRPLRHLSDWQVVTFGRWRREHPDSTVIGQDTGYGRRYEGDTYAANFSSEELHFPVERNDARLGNKAVVIGVTDGERATAYSIQSVHAAPQGVLTDPWPEGDVVLRSVGDAQGVSIEHLPPGCRAIHTFWFAWAAFYPQTELYSKQSQ